MKPQMDTRKKFELQMGFEPSTLRSLDGCSNHWATVYKRLCGEQGRNVGFD